MEGYHFTVVSQRNFYCLLNHFLKDIKDEGTLVIIFRKCEWQAISMDIYALEAVGAFCFD